ncbi:NAD-dependent epimerase/dehydratase family protein [Rhodovarius sp.]|uniref:NAD-dependent epimerase/dehydratase family protein n=1 Tax=Rhodovarius sp. TaxID=2972673 RepID=UPI0034A1D27D
MQLTGIVKELLDARVLVTGGAGFLGQHVVARLCQIGARVTVMDTAERPASLPAHLDLTYHQSSILNTELVRTLVGEADLVLHLAGIAEPLRYGSNPLETMDVNLLGSIQVAQACTAARVPMLFSSTSEIYGINPNSPWAEDADRVLGPVRNTRWCYSSSKAAVEHYLDACRREQGLNYTVVRLFNVYGPNLHGRVVDRFIRAALSGAPLSIYGDGQQTRSFCHVDDVVDALIGLITRIGEGPCVFNIGNDAEVTIQDFADLIIRLTDSRSPVVMTPSSPYLGYQDVPRRRPDIGLIRRTIGWAPTVSLEAGLLRMIESMRPPTVRASQESLA